MEKYRIRTIKADTVFLGVCLAAHISGGGLYSFRFYGIQAGYNAVLH